MKDVAFLVHIVDSTAENPIENYEKINTELKKHSEKLANLYQIVALNKIDSIDDDRKQELYNEFKTKAADVFLISAVTGENVEQLKYFMGEKVDEIEKPESDIIVEEDLGATNNDDSAYEVSKVAKDTFVVVGGKIGRLAQVTDERNPEQVIRLQNILTGMGVFDKLKSMGVKDGDTIIVGHLEFTYYADEFYG